MKSISVTDVLHRYLMNHRDADHKTVGDVVSGLIGVNDVLKRAFDKLSDDVSSNRMLASELTKDEQQLIFLMLDGSLQSEDNDVRDLAQSIEQKLVL